MVAVEHHKRCLDYASGQPDPSTCRGTLCCTFLWWERRGNGAWPRKSRKGVCGGEQKSRETSGRVSTSSPFIATSCRVAEKSSVQLYDEAIHERKLDLEQHKSHHPFSSDCNFSQKFPESPRASATSYCMYPPSARSRTCTSTQTRACNKKKRRKNKKRARTGF